MLTSSFYSKLMDSKMWMFCLIFLATLCSLLLFLKLLDTFVILRKMIHRKYLKAYIFNCHAYYGYHYSRRLAIHGFKKRLKVPYKHGLCPRCEHHDMLLANPCESCILFPDKYDCHHDTFLVGPGPYRI